VILCPDLETKITTHGLYALVFKLVLIKVLLVTAVVCSHEQGGLVWRMTDTETTVNASYRSYRNAC
jgi:hypothetical protein